jgi:AcrR family transcriptional regulator
VRKPPKRTLTRDDWTAAALDALARGGLDAIAVEPIATTLDATKGSFYWHFKNRDALIEAALEEWERRGTLAVIEVLKGEHTPAERLKKLFEMTSEMPPELLAMEIALLGAPDQPIAVRAVRRVAERRIAYVTQELEGTGWDPASALDRAFLIYYLFVGRLLAKHTAPRVTGIDSRQRYAQLIFETIVAPPSIAGKVASDSSHVGSQRSRRRSNPSPSRRVPSARGAKATEVRKLST